MAFADWKKRSKLFQNTRARNRPDQIDAVCEAAYKAGERDGRKQAEEVAEQAIKLRELMRSNAALRGDSGLIAGVPLESMVVRQNDSTE